MLFQSVDYTIVTDNAPRTRAELCEKLTCWLRRPLTSNQTLRINGIGPFLRVYEIDYVSFSSEFCVKVDIDPEVVLLLKGKLVLIPECFT